MKARQPRPDSAAVADSRSGLTPGGESRGLESVAKDKDRIDDESPDLEAMDLVVGDEVERVA